MFAFQHKRTVVTLRNVLLHLQVENLHTVDRDQIFCVSANKKFLRPKESQRFVEIKANWVRACKRRGHQATDLDKILFAGSSSNDELDDDVSSFVTFASMFNCLEFGGLLVLLLIKFTIINKVSCNEESVRSRLSQRS